MLLKYLTSDPLRIIKLGTKLGVEFNWTEILLQLIFRLFASGTCRRLSLANYTQTKKIRSIFMVLYLLIQLRCLSKKIPKCLSNVWHTKVGKYLSLSSYLEELLNLKWKKLIPLSSASWSSKRDTFYVKWQPGTFNDEKTSKNSKCAY